METNWPMQTNFQVQAKWFDDLVARGKLSRDQWLQYAYDTTIGFSGRKRNFEALETYEKDKAITRQMLRSFSARLLSDVQRSLGVQILSRKCRGGWSSLLYRTIGRPSWCCGVHPEAVKPALQCLMSLVPNP